MSLEIQQLLRDIDLLDFLEDQDIPFETSGKNIGDGWAGLEDCPWCGATNFHFGINISNKSINCWVCNIDGTLIKLVMKLNLIPMENALNILQHSLERSRFTADLDLEDKVRKTFTHKPRVIEEEEEELDIITLPGVRIISRILFQRPKLKAFLEERRISVKSCIKHRFRYDYNRSMRLVMPIFKGYEKIVAYQGRDITGRAMLPYINQPKNVDLGKLLFNLNNNTHHAGLVTEGIIDAVRMEEMIDEYIGEESICSIACFTNSPTDDQLELIAKTGWKVLLVAMDHDSWINYRKFVGLPMPVEPVILPRGADPASISDEEFKNLNLAQYI